MIMETAFTHEINLWRIALKLDWGHCLSDSLFSSNTFKTLGGFFSVKDLETMLWKNYDRKGAPPKLMTHQLKGHKLMIQKWINDTWWGWMLEKFKADQWWPFEYWLDKHWLYAATTSLLYGVIHSRRRASLPLPLCLSDGKTIHHPPW